jgi:hypothetical protein
MKCLLIILIIAISYICSRKMRKHRSRSHLQYPTPVFTVFGQGSKWSAVDVDVNVVNKDGDDVIQMKELGNGEDKEDMDNNEDNKEESIEFFPYSEIGTIIIETIIFKTDPKNPYLTLLNNKEELSPDVIANLNIIIETSKNIPKEELEKMDPNVKLFNMHRITFNLDREEQIRMYFDWDKRILLKYLSLVLKKLKTSIAEIDPDDQGPIDNISEQLEQFSELDNLKEFVDYYEDLSNAILDIEDCGSDDKKCYNEKHKEAVEKFSENEKKEGTIVDQQQENEQKEKKKTSLNISL